MEQAPSHNFISTWIRKDENKLRRNLFASENQEDVGCLQCTFQFGILIKSTARADLHTESYRNENKVEIT